MYYVGLHGVVFALGDNCDGYFSSVVLSPNRKRVGVNMFAIFSNMAMVFGTYLSVYIALSSYGSMALYIFLTVMTGLCGLK